MKYPKEPSTKRSLGHGTNGDDCVPELTAATGPLPTRVFSGVQPTGNLHIGNYLGALKSWAEIQSHYESIFCIVDLHAVTLYQEPAELSKKIRETAALFLA